jgi:hypothetical protein
MNYNDYAGYRDLMYFQNNGIVNDYFLALTESGQVYYGVSDEAVTPTIKWKLVNIDEKALSVLH